VLTLYLDGAVSTTVTGRALNINRASTPHIVLGSWYEDDTAAFEGGDFSINTLRMHDGCLTAAQVRSGGEE
jgi:hypothetical protein